jgi:hypothetical protein
MPRANSLFSTLDKTCPYMARRILWQITSPSLSYAREAPSFREAFGWLIFYYPLYSCII